MSSRADAKKWMTLCKHMRESIIDEKKASPDYRKLIREAQTLGAMTPAMKELFKTIVGGIADDEEKHRRQLTALFDDICPRMAFHRKGVE